MSTRTRLVLAVLLALTWPVGSGRAEMSAVVENQQPPQTLLMGINEGTDPIDSRIWQKYTNSAVANTLNTGGADRGDGRPCLTWNAQSQWPKAVWAYNEGSSFDLAFAEWTGNGWSTIAFVAASHDDELDPHLFVDPDGKAYVVWWVPGVPSRVFFSSRAAFGTQWSVPIQITPIGESGRRPSVAVRNGVVHVAYEMPDPTANQTQHVVVRTINGPALGSTEIVASTSRNDRLDAVVHTRNDRLWVSWKHSNDDFGYSEMQSAGWDPVRIEAWPDPTWIGVEMVRRVIMREVLSPGGNITP